VSTMIFQQCVFATAFLYEKTLLHGG